MNRYTFHTHMYGTVAVDAPSLGDARDQLSQDPNLLDPPQSVRLVVARLSDRKPEHERTGLLSGEEFRFVLPVSVSVVVRAKTEAEARALVARPADLPRDCRLRVLGPAPDAHAPVLIDPWSDVS